MTLVVDALAYLHGKGICHRDVKPHNFVFDGGRKVMLVDFGEAKIIENGDSATTTTRTATGMRGTLNYMAPQVMRANKRRGRTYNPLKSDMWSLGVSIFQCLALCLPFDAETDVDMMRDVCNMDSTNTLPEDVNPFWQEVV